MIANLSLKFGEGIKLAITTKKPIFQYHKLVIKNFTFSAPKDNNKHKLDENNLLNNTKKAKAKTHKTQNLDTTPNYKSFSKNMNQNSHSEREKAKSEANTNKKIKSMEEQKEINVSRRNVLKNEKEKNYKKRITSSEKPNRESYTGEEFSKLIANPKISEIIFFKITNAQKTQVNSLIKTAVYLIFPLSVSGLFFIDFFCFDFKNISILMKFAHYFLISFAYVLFLMGIYILKRSRNIVLSAKLFPKDNVLEFTKFSTFGRLIRIKERVGDMKLNRNSWLNPDDSIKSKRTNKNYIFKDDQAEIKDKKLFNYLFPEPEIKERKRPSMVDSLWEKN